MELNTEQLFETALDESFIENEEIQYEIQEEESSQNARANYYLYSQVSLSEVEERQRYLADESIPDSERYSQKFFERFAHKAVPHNFPPPKPLTQKEREIRETIKNSMVISNREVDNYFYNPKVRYERPKDETPEAVRKLCLEKKFVKAKEMYEVMTQSQNPAALHAADSTEAVGDEFWSQLRRIESEDKKTRKSVHWGDQPSTSGASSALTRTKSFINHEQTSQNIANSIADAILMDFDDIDNETLAVIQEQQLLNESLGNLSQILSQNAEFIDGNLSQSLGEVKLDVSQVDLKKTLEDGSVSDEEDEILNSAFFEVIDEDEVIPASDDEEIPASDDEDFSAGRLMRTTTTQLEAKFLLQTQYESQIQEEISGKPDEFAGRLVATNTEALENNFLLLTQYESQIPEAFEEEIKGKQEEKFAGRLMKTSTTQLENNFLLQTQYESQIPDNFEEELQRKLQEFSGRLLQTNTEALENNFLLQTQYESQYPEVVEEKVETKKKEIEESLKKAREKSTESRSGSVKDQKIGNSSKSFGKKSRRKLSSEIASTSGCSDANNSRNQTTGTPNSSFSSGRTSQLNKSILEQFGAVFGREDEKDQGKSMPPAFSGFKLASGKTVKPKNSTVNKYKAALELEEKKYDTEEGIKAQPMPPAFSGFKLASGKTVKPKDSTVNKYKAALELEEKKYDTEEGIKAQPMPPAFSGFKLASGKTVKPKDSTVNKYKAALELEEKKYDTEEGIKAQPMPPAFSGFKLASGKTVKPKDSTVNKYKASLELQDKKYDTEEGIKAQSMPPAFSGFKLASGKTVKPKDSTVNKYKAALELEEKKYDTEEGVKAQPMPPAFSGFKLASGKTVKPKDSTVNKYKAALELEDKKYDTEEGVKAAQMPPAFSGFKLASGKTVKPKDSTLNRFKAAFELDEKKINDKQKKTVEENELSELDAIELLMPALKRKKTPIHSEFSPKSSRHSILSSRESYQRETSELQGRQGTPGTSRGISHTPGTSRDISNTPGTSRDISGTPDFSKYALITPGRCINLKANKRSSSNLPATPGSSRNSSAIPRTLLPSSKPSDSPASSLQSSRIAESLARFAQAANSPGNFSGFSMLKISDKNLKKIAENIQKEDEKIQKEVEAGDNFETPGKPPKKKQRLDFGNSPISSSPFMMDRFKKGVNVSSTPLIPRRKTPGKLTDSQEVSTILKLCSGLDDSSETIEDFQPSPKKSKFAKKLLPEFNESDENFEMEEIDSIEREHNSYYIIADDIKKARKKSLEQQRKFVREKSHGDRVPMAGSVIMIKSNRNRKKIKDFVGEDSPATLNRHHITSKTAVDFQFSMENHVSEKIWKTNTDGISIGDNARLIFNEKSKVGVDEIKWSFLASPGVDPKLVSDRWIENVFKMLVLKFSWLENSFEKFDRFELLSPENLLLQMKFRYDREIDRHQRSAIKKIVELDDVPYRRMVLKVIDILDSPGVGYELELTDGWYSIRATIDSVLANACLGGKITIGTKLMISCAELVGCQGFDPLDIPDSVRLKLHANSTRRTTWDYKMGFCKNPNPIAIKVDSVSTMGGVVGKLQVVVTHVYPMIYVNIDGDKKEFRSEKIQNRIKNKLDIINFTLHERIANQVQDEEMKELRQRVQIIKNSRVKVEEMSTEDVCDMLDGEDGDESAYIQGQLSVKTQRKVQALRDERRQALNDKIRKKIGENSPKVKQLLKFRVVDATNPKKTAVISWWSPSEDLVDIVKLGNHLEILSTTAGAQGKEIQVTASTSSNVRIKKRKRINENFYRTDTKVSDINKNFKPANDEFDVSCIVVHVNKEKINNYVKVFVVDETRSVLCLNFWSSLEDFAYEDVVVEGQVMHARNLQWRSSHAGEKLPQAFVNSDSTMFTTHPTSETQRERLEKLREILENSENFVNRFKEDLGFLAKPVDKENRWNNQPTVSPSPVTPGHNNRPMFTRSSAGNSRYTPYTTPKNSSVKDKLAKSLEVMMGRPDFSSPSGTPKTSKPLPHLLRSYKQPTGRPVFKNSFRNTN